MNSKLKMGLKGVVIGAAIQVVAIPVMAEEIHGNETAFSVSLGSQSLENDLGQASTAIGNTAIGFMAQRDNTTGGSNTAVGRWALSNNKTGSSNVAIGTGALSDSVLVVNSVAVGDHALKKSHSQHNVAIGNGALGETTTGQNNVAFGSLAGAKNTTGSHNVFLGYRAGWNDSYVIKSNQLVIANGEAIEQQLITGDFEQKTIGLNGSVAVKNGLDVKGELRAFQSLRVNKGIYTNDHLKVKKTATAQSFNTTSDARLKDDLQPINDALSSVLRLQGKTYRWKEDHHKQDIGLIAQEVEQVFPELVDQDANGFKAIAYSRLTAVLIEAIKEQQGQIASLQQENRELKSRIDSELSLLLSRVSVLEGVPLAQR